MDELRKKYEKEYQGLCDVSSCDYFCLKQNSAHYIESKLIELYLHDTKPHKTYGYNMDMWLDSRDKMDDMWSWMRTACGWIRNLRVIDVSSWRGYQTYRQFQAYCQFKRDKAYSRRSLDLCDKLKHKRVMDELLYEMHMR